MLAFESAWRILTAEHAQMRALVVSILHALEAGRWRSPGPERALLRRRLEDLQSFDNQRHRPKGTALIAALRGKSGETDALLDTLEAEQAQCDRLLAEAMALVAQLEDGRLQAADEVEARLKQHADLLLGHLEREDTALLDLSAKWLTPQDWSTIVSSMSSVVRSTARRRTEDAVDPAQRRV
jgi:hemerythrin-like domain-containing protein